MICTSKLAASGGEASSLSTGSWHRHSVQQANKPRIIALVTSEYNCLRDLIDMVTIIVDVRNLDIELNTRFTGSVFTNLTNFACVFWHCVCAAQTAAQQQEGYAIQSSNFIIRFRCAKSDQYSHHLLVSLSSSPTLFVENNLIVSESRVAEEFSKRKRHSMNFTRRIN